MTSTTEDLATARAILSDIRYSIIVRKLSCSECSAERWDDWDAYQIRNLLGSALTKIEKAMEISNGK